MDICLKSAIEQQDNENEILVAVDGFIEESHDILNKYGNKIKVSTSSDSTDNIIGVVSGNASVIGDSSWNKWSDKYLRDDYGAYQRDENGERKLNPSFDDTKTYVSREDRQEWDAIGMVGKLRIRKGQITGTRWIKMRDISDTVEEWLVR